MQQPHLITIGERDGVCTVCPALGGSLIGWSVAGQEMLRRTDAAAVMSGDPLALASFPLVPFSNRIGNARFNWAGREINLTPNFAPEPHAIHGIGWTTPWLVEGRGDNHVELSLHHECDEAWPWSFAAHQRISLENDALILRLSVANLANEAAPLAFGHHPYFYKAGARLTFSATDVLMSGDDALPTIAVAPQDQFDFSLGGLVAGRTIDHCYAGWDGKAQIIWADQPLSLRIEADMPAIVVYVPEGGDYFCFEPVPHINNALNMSDNLPQMPSVAPGARYETHIRFTAYPSTTDLDYQTEK